MTVQQEPVPPLATVAQLIALLRQFPQELPVSKDLGTAGISQIAVIPADYGQQVDIS